MQNFDCSNFKERNYENYQSLQSLYQLVDKTFKIKFCRLSLNSTCRDKSKYLKRDDNST